MSCTPSCTRSLCTATWTSSSVAKWKPVRLKLSVIIVMVMVVVVVRQHSSLLIPAPRISYWFGHNSTDSVVVAQSFSTRMSRRSLVDLCATMVGWTARQFMTNHAVEHQQYHHSELEELKGVTTTENMASSNFVEIFRSGCSRQTGVRLVFLSGISSTRRSLAPPSDPPRCPCVSGWCRKNKYTLVLCSYSFELLLAFLQVFFNGMYCKQSVGKNSRDDVILLHRQDAD